MKKIFSLLVIAMFAFTGCKPSSEDPSTVNVSRVTLNKQSLNLLVDATFTLVATIEPNDATEKGVTWVSSNPTVVAANPGYQVALDTYTKETRLLRYWSSTSLDDYIPGQEDNYMMCAISFSCITPDFSIFPYKNSPGNISKVRPILSFKY